MTCRIGHGVFCAVCIAAPCGLGAPDVLCAQDAPPTPPPRDAAPVSQKKLAPEEAAERHARLLQKKVTQLRGLPFKRDVHIRLQTERDLRSRLCEELADEYPRERMEGVQKAGVKLGIFPEGFDLGKTLLDVLTEQVAGFYDPKRKELYVIRRDAGAGGRFEEDLVEMLTGIAAQDVFAIHELTHAAQDQSFDLETLPLDVRDNDDLALAVKAVVEGDATYVMFDCLARSLGGDIDQLAAAGLPTEVLPFEGKAQRAPEFVKQSLVFPYLRGFEFVRRAKGRGGWDRVAALYDDPPASTEQILHPEKYFGEERDAPTLLRWNAPPTLLESQWRLLESNVLGEFGVRILLKGRKPSAPAAASRGWDGDRYEVYEKQGGGRLLLLWATTWDTEPDAVEFGDALAAIFAARAGKDGELPAPAKDWRGWRIGDESAWIAMAGKDVFVADGMESAAAPQKLLDEWRQGMRREVLTKVARVPKKAAPPGPAPAGAPAGPNRKERQY